MAIEVSDDGLAWLTITPARKNDTDPQPQPETQQVDLWLLHVDFCELRDQVQDKGDRAWYEGLQQILLSHGFSKVSFGAARKVFHAVEEKIAEFVAKKKDEPGSKPDSSPPTAPESCPSTPAPG